MRYSVSGVAIVNPGGALGAETWDTGEVDGVSRRSIAPIPRLVYAFASKLRASEGVGYLSPMDVGVMRPTVYAALYRTAYLRTPRYSTRAAMGYGNVGYGRTGTIVDNG